MTLMDLIRRKVENLSDGERDDDKSRSSVDAWRK